MSDSILLIFIRIPKWGHPFLYFLLVKHYDMEIDLDIIILAIFRGFAAF